MVYGDAGSRLLELQQITILEAQEDNDFVMEDSAIVLSPESKSN